MKTRYAIPLILFGLLSVALASDWDLKFADVCKYDRWCLRLKTSDGAWLRPKPEVIAILKDKEIQDQIKKSAALYGVDAVALAGAILAENSLNVGLKDSVQTFLAKQAGITSLGSRDFTFGFGQIGVTAAMEAEAHVAKIEGRNPKSRDELVTEITNPTGSIRIAAAILRKVQDDYKTEGFDISKDPALLTTLYNLGKSEERAKQAKSSGLPPRQNYFGLFVARYAGEIQKVVGAAKAVPPPAPPKPVAQAATPPKQNAVASVPVKPAPDVVSTRTPAKVSPREPVKRQKERVTAAALKTSIPLVSQPMQCRSSDYGQDPEREAKSTSYGAPIGVMEAGAVFREISRALDCKSKVWKLIKDEKGMSGWIQEDRLEKATTQKLVPKMNCRPSPAQSKCIASIRAIVGELALDEDLENGLIFLKPVTAPNSKLASFADEDRQCGFNPEINDDDSQIRRRNRGNSRQLGNAPVVQSTNFSIEELQKKAKDSLDFVRREMRRMSAETGIAEEDLDSPMNPYQRTFQIMAGIERDVRECHNSSRSESISCRDSKVLPDEVQKTIGFLKYKKNPPISEVTEASMNLENRYYSNQGDYLQVSYYFNQSDELIAAATPEVIRESLVNCEARLTAIQEKLAADSKNAAQFVPPPQGTPSPAPTPMTVQGGGGYAWGSGMGMGGFGYMGGGTYGMTFQVANSELFRTIKTAKPEDIEKHKASLIAAARYCHGRLNLSGSSESKNPLDCTEAPEIVAHRFQNFAKEYVRTVIGEDPFSQMAEALSGVQNMVQQEILDELRGAAPPPPIAIPFPKEEEFEPRGSYCPNRTAEMIEALLQENSCISHAYVPTDFLSKKLSQTDQRVVYRKFEKDDRYAIEVGVGACSPVMK